MFLIVILYALFSVMTFMNSAVMLANPYPFFFSMIRSWGMVVFLFGYCLLFHRSILKNFSLPVHGWKALIIFGFCIHGFGFAYAIQYLDPVKVCFMVAMAPFLTAVFQYFLYRESLTQKKVLGLLIGFGGLIPILLLGDHGAYAQIPKDLQLFGVIVCFVATVMSAYGWIVMNQFLKEFSYPLAIINSIAMFIGGCSSCVFFLIYEPNMFSMTFTSNFSIYTAILIGISLMTYWLYPYLLKTFSVTFLSFASFLRPAFGMLLGILLMGHPMSMIAVGALCTIALGLYLFYQEELISIHRI